MPALPDILLIDIPSRFAGQGLALDRYYPVILETMAEASEFEAFLCKDRPVLITPSLLDRRPSAFLVGDLTLARYAPPAAGWPWLVLCCWPLAYTRMVPVPNDYLARGSYTIEAFAEAEEIDAFEQQFFAGYGPCASRTISPTGNA